MENYKLPKGYEERRQKLTFLYNSYAGGDSFKQYLRKFSNLEPEENWQYRKDLIAYGNLVKPGVNLYSSFIFGKPLNRTISDDSFYSDCDNNGNSLDMFFSHIAADCMIYGKGNVLIDSGKTVPEFGTATGYFLTRIPEKDVIEAIFDENKNCLKIVFFEKNNVILSLNAVDKLYVRYAKEESGTDYAEIERGLYNFYAVPFFSADLQESQILDIADLAKLHLNLTSGLDWFHLRQCFPTMILPGYKPRSGDKEVIEHGSNALATDEADQKPYYISPPVDTAVRIQERLSKIEDQITALFGITGGQASIKSTEASGASLAVQFQGFNARISLLAQKLQGLENLIADWLMENANLEYSVQYNSDYSTFAISDIIQIIKTVNELGIRSDSLDREIAEKLIKSLFPNIGDEVKENILNEIAEAQKIEKRAPTIGDIENGRESEPESE